MIEKDHLGDWSPEKDREHTKKCQNKRTQRIQKIKNAASNQNEHNKNKDRASRRNQILVKKFNDLSELANSIYLKIKDDTKEFKNRKHTTFNKIQPNKEDLQALNEIAEALMTIQPETDPTYGKSIMQSMRLPLQGKTTPEIKANREPT